MRIYIQKLLLFMIGIFCYTAINAQSTEATTLDKTNIQINNVTDCTEPGGQVSFDVTLRVFTSDPVDQCDNNDNKVYYNYVTSFYINGNTTVFNLNDLDLNTGLYTSPTGEYTVEFLDDDYDVAGQQNILNDIGNIPSLTMCDDLPADNPCDNSSENPCPQNTLIAQDNQFDLWFRVTYNLPSNIAPGVYSITASDTFDNKVYYSDGWIESDNGTNSFPAAYQSSIDNEFVVKDVALTGLNQIGNTSNTFTLDANTPFSTTGFTCAGTWTGPTSANFANVNDPQSTVTFTEGTTGPQTLTWTIDCNGCISTDEVVITLSAPPATVSGHLYLDNNGNGIQDAGEPNLANIDIKIYDALENMHTVTTDADGNWASIVVPGELAAFVDEDDPDFPSGVTQTEGSNPTIVTAVEGQDVDAGNDGYFQAGIISGNVGLDSNYDGSGDHAVVNAIVTLTYTDTMVAQTAITDTNGMYIFTGLVPGNYELSYAEPSDQVSISDIDTSTGPNDPDGDDSAAGSNNVIPVILTQGELDEDNNFVDIELATVCGHLYLDSNGNGTQDAGEPDLANVDVFIYDPLEVMHTVTTDADGNWCAILLPGTLLVSVNENDPDFPSGVTQTEGTNPTIVTAVGGEDVDAGNDGYFQAGTISGNVSLDTDNNGSGDQNVSGVTVTLTNIITNATQTATTDANGDYSFTGLAPGNYEVSYNEPIGQTSVSDFDSSTGATDPDGDDSAAGPNNVISIILAQGEVDADNNFVDEQLATVFGHLYFDNNGNGTQDIGEPDLANVDVLITDVNGDQQTVTTDANGDWTATVVLGSTTANVDETDPQYPTGATQTEGTDPTTVTAVGGQIVDAGNDGYFQAGTITGNVSLDTNNDNIGESGIEVVTIELYKDENSDGLFTSGVDTIVASSITDANGDYSFENLLAGYYVVVETQPLGYINGLDLDSVNDGVSDSDANSNDQDDQLAVILAQGETDTGNDFIERTGNFNISGNVFYDVDALIDNQVNGFNFTPMPTLFAVLINESNGVVAVNELGVIRSQGEGTFEFLNTTGGYNCRVLLRATEPVVGDVLSVSDLPLYYFNTGENIGAGIGSDGTVDGISASFLLDRDYDNVNFGIIYFIISTTP